MPTYYTDGTGDEVNAENEEYRRALANLDRSIGRAELKLSLLILFGVLLGIAALCAGSI